MEDTERPKRLGYGAWGGGRAWPGFETTRRAKLAARTASGRAAATRQQHADKQENTSSADGKQAARDADGKQAARGTDAEQAARDADGKQAARGTDAEQAARDADGKQAARGTDAEQAGRAGGPPPPGTNTQNTRIQRGRDPLRQTAQRTPAS